MKEGDIVVCDWRKGCLMKNIGFYILLLYLLIYRCKSLIFSFLIRVEINYLTIRY